MKEQRRQQQAVLRRKELEQRLRAEGILWLLSCKYQTGMPFPYFGLCVLFSLKLNNSCISFDVVQ